MNDQIEDQAQQIIPQLRWVSDTGGAEIRRIGSKNFGEVKIAGLDFEWRLNDSFQHNHELTCHKLHDTRDWITLSCWRDGKVDWSLNRTLEGRLDHELETQPEILFLTADGECSTVAEAAERARDWVFEPQEQAGFTWHKTGPEKWRSANWGDELEVSLINKKEDGFAWLWTRRLKKLEPLLTAIGDYQLSGWSPTREQAMLDASQAVDKVLEQCLLVTGDDNQFERGKAAGRAELAAEFNQLVCGSKK